MIGITAAPSEKTILLTTVLTGALLGATLTPAYAAVQAGRERVLLSGIWDEGGQVPHPDGYSFQQRTFRRRATVPESWRGRRVALCFGAVNYVADVFVGNQRVTRHVGPWIPFEVDITPHVVPGEEFQLRVEVQGRTRPPISAPGWKPLWPIGEARPQADEKSCGILDDVYLLAYGLVHVCDVRIETSVRDKTITLDYTLRNADDRPRTVQLQAEALRAATGAAELTLRSAPVALAPGEEKAVHVQKAWNSPALWWPDDPQLYHLRTRLVEKGQTVDEETRRFGFREIWVDGAGFRLNGVAANFPGDYVLFGNDKHWPARMFTPEGFPDAVRRLKAINIRVLRFHKRPAPQWALDVCDELGLAVTAESALNGATGNSKDMFTEPELSQYLKHSETWVAAWVEAQRNHPSILFWSAMNEMFMLPAARSTAIGAVIDKHDGTRPILYEGHDNHPLSKVDGPVLSLHYPRVVNAQNRWNAEPWGQTAGDWNRFVRGDKPTTMGEGIYVPASSPPNAEQERNIWWQGIWPRGMRAGGWDAISPAVFRWVCELDASRPSSQLRIANLRCAFAPVALFDPAYDELGIAPFVENRLPALRAGERATRTLRLFNDAFRGQEIEAEFEIRAAGRVLSSARRTYRVPLGEHIEFRAEFTVPAEGNALDFVRRTFKDGKPQFEEARSFRIEPSSAPPKCGAATLSEAITKCGSFAPGCRPLSCRSTSKEMFPEPPQAAAPL